MISEKKIRDVINEYSPVGISIAITDRDKPIGYVNCGCESMDRPNLPPTENTLYKIASITKTVTAICAMRLAADGALDLDRPIREYIPDMKIFRSDLGGIITARMLLSHTAGLPKEYTPIGPRDESALEESLRREITDADPEYEPGRGYLYSNLGFRLASLIMERIAGEPYSKLAEKLVLSPLGMNASTFDICVAATYPLALPHTLDENGNAQLSHRIEVNAARLAAGGLYSSANDLTKLIRCLMRGGKSDTGSTVIPEWAAAQMLCRHADTRTEEKNGYGLGIIILSGCEPLYGHTGTAPPYSSAAFFNPKSGIGMAALINSPTAGLARRLAYEILR